MAKRSALFGLMCVLAAGVALAVAAENPQQEETGATALRVGTFDSRAVAFAAIGQQIRAGGSPVRTLYAERDKARAAGDEDRVKEIEAKGEALQKTYHRMVFGHGRIDDILKDIKDELPELARAAQVDVITEEVLYSDSSVEVVDLTISIVQLFDPDEKTLETIEALRKHPPVSDEVIETMECGGGHNHDK